MVQILRNCNYIINNSDKMSKENAINLSKQSLPQLQELLERQHALIQNRKLLQHLKDKGESVIQLHDKIQKEIQFRKNLEHVEASVSTMTLSPDNGDFLKDKHVEYVCSMEKPIADTRYRPHRTLIHKETKTSPIKSPKKFTEITSALEPKLRHDGVKCISLLDSLNIENDQALRVMEEKARKALSSLNEMIAGNGDADDDSEEGEEENLEKEIVHEES